MIDSLPNFRIIRQAIVSAHNDKPSLLADLKDRTRVETLLNSPYLQAFLSEMRLEAQQAHQSPIVPLTFQLFQQFETSGERASYEQFYFMRRRHLVALVLGIVIDGHDDYWDAINNLLWEICNEYTWALPAHIPVGIDRVKAERLPPDQVIDLFASETAHMLAEINDLLGDQLAGWLSYRIHHEIERRIFQPMFNHAQAFKWETDTHNWAAVCGGCIGMTALLIETNRERLAGMIDRVIRAMGSFLSGFDTDGGCPEGISYWDYGFGYYVYFAERLSSFTDGAIDMLTSDHIRQIAMFPGRIGFGGGGYINYSDASSDVKIHAGLGCYLSKKLEIIIPDLKAPSFHDDRIYRWAHITHDLIWTNPESLNQPVHDQTVYLDKLGWVIDRRTVNGTSITFSAKGGHNAEPHNHNDLGNFVLYAEQIGLLIDLGAGVYTRQYFSEERYNIIHTSSLGHSVPIINGLGQEAGINYRAEVLFYQRYPTSVSYVLNLTSAYAVPSLRSLIRTFDWSVEESSNSAILLLSDTFEFSEAPVQLESCFMSMIAPYLGDGRIIWESGNIQLVMRYDKHEFDALIDRIETENHHYEPITVYRLRMCAQGDALLRYDRWLFEVNINAG